MWDNCIMDAWIFYFMACLVAAFIMALAYSMYKAAKDVALPMHAAQSNAENTLATSSGKNAATAIRLVGLVLLTVLPWADTCTDIAFDVGVQDKMDNQTQFDCDLLNQKGMFDSSGFILREKPYPSTSEYENFNEYIQKLLVYFPVTSLREKTSIAKTRCLDSNMPFPLPPDCEYNAAEYACVQVAAWVKPNTVFR